MALLSHGWGWCTVTTPMTLQQLLTIRHFLTKVVARGQEEHALIEAIDTINAAIEKLQSRKHAA